MLDNEINPFLVLHINRENIVRETLSQVVKLATIDYKKQLHVSIAKKHCQKEKRNKAMSIIASFACLLKRRVCVNFQVVFHNEQAVDAGGVRKVS